MSREVVSSEWLDARISERAALERKYAEVIGQRDWLVERLRELAEGWQGIGEWHGCQTFRAGNVQATKSQAYRHCAERLTAIVTEAESERNRSAT